MSLSNQTTKGGRKPPFYLSEVLCLYTGDSVERVILAILSSARPRVRGKPTTFLRQWAGSIEVLAILSTGSGPLPLVLRYKS